MARQHPQARRARSTAKPWMHSKISATIIAFGRPLIDELPSDASVKLREETVGFIILVWNAHVMAHPTWGRPEVLAELRANMANHHAQGELPDEALQALEVLSLRRQQPPFADDPRAVGDWEVRILDKTQWNLRCDARLPST